MCYPTSHSSSCSYFVKISVIALFPLTVYPHTLLLPAQNGLLWSETLLCDSCTGVDQFTYIACSYSDFLFRLFYFNMWFISFPFYSRYASISCFASFIISYTFISKEMWIIATYISLNRIRYVLKTDSLFSFELR
jgi:hypothetical protein